MDQNSNKNNSRREFLFSMAGGAAAIAGYFLMPDSLQEEIPTKVSPSNFPSLADQTVINRKEGILSINHSTGKVVCSVNEMGFQIIDSLDGKSSVQHIASTLAKKNKLDHTEKMETSIALFLVEVSKAGLLNQPFIIKIVERYSA